MGFDLKQWLLVLVSMILVGLLVKGYIRMRASRNRIQMKLDKSFVSRVGEITEVGESGVRVRAFASEDRLRFIRLVDFGRDGILTPPSAGVSE